MILLALVLALTGFPLVSHAPSAVAAPLDVHVGANVVNGREVITRRIEVPFTTIEKREEKDPDIHWNNCIQTVVRVLDTEFLGNLPSSSWTGYPDGSNAPTVIGVYHPRSPNSYGTGTVVDLAQLSQDTGEDFGSGLGIVALSRTTANDDGCSQEFVPPSELEVPVVGVSAWDTAVDVDITAVGSSTSLYSFAADAEHPVVKDIVFSYAWVIEGGPGFGGAVLEGADIVANFTSTNPESPNYRHWELRVSDENGTILARREGRMQSLDVSLSRPNADPVRVGESFPVTLKVAAPTDNPGVLTTITPVTSDIVLPDWVELVDGDLLDNFTLAPGESKTATLALRATDADSGELVATWRGTDAFGGTVEGIGRLELTAVGTFDGDWFRTDNLGDSVRQGDTAPIRLRVENQTGQPLTDVVLTDVSVTEPAESGTEAPEGVGGAHLTAKPDALRGVLGPTGADALDFLDFDLEGVQPGQIELSATFTGKDPGGRAVTGMIAETWQVVDRPLTVRITPHLRRADGSLPELNLDNDGDGDIDLADHRFDVEVTISNEVDESITDLKFDDAAEPVSWSNNLIGEDQGAPKMKIIGVRGDPVTGPDGEPAKGPIEDLDVAIPDLARKGAPGDSYTVTFVYEATGELDAEGQAVVDATMGDRAVRGSGMASIKFASGLLLEFSSWLTDPDRLTTSGQVVRIDGYVKNLDEDEKDANGTVTKEGRSIAVWISPITEGNAGGGYLAAREGGRTPLGAEFLELAPGQKLSLHGILTTRPTAVRTDAHVEYLVSAWNLPGAAGDQANPIPPERIDLVENPEKGWGTAHDQRLRFADVGEQDLKACETHLYDAIVTCNFYEGVVSMLTSTVDAGKMAKAGVEQIGQATYWTGAWAMRQLGDIALALGKDPQAQARLAAELNTQLSTWYNLSILAGDASNATLAALSEFIHRTAEVVDKGDTEAALAWVAKFAGENPDAAIGFLFKARALAAMGQSALRSEARSVAGTIVREAVESEAQLASRRLAAEIDLAVARGLDPKTPAILKGGLDVTDTPKVWRDVYGAARDDVQKMLQIAKEEGVLIAFRSRSPISIKLLEQKLAWLKPQSVKAKSVSAIDIKYLGFPEDALGKVVMVQPPFGAQLRGGALEEALDEQMALLRHRHPELLDEVHAAEVRDRMKLRATKYHEHLAEWIDYAENGMPVGFGYSKNGVASGRDIEELRNVRLEVSQVPNPDGGPALTRIDLKVAGPGDTDFRYLTGDIDIVGFFNLDRSPIMDPAKRAILYEKMRSLLGMQHGETLTWDHAKRAELLREHVGDNAETLLVAAPNERLYTSVLDEKKSSEVAPGGNFADTFTLLNGPPKELKSPVQPLGPTPSGRLTSLADDTRTTLQRAQPFLLPGRIVHVMNAAGGAVPVSEGQSRAAAPLVVRPDGHIEIYQSAANTPNPLRSPAALALRPAGTTLMGPPDPDPGLVAARALLGANDPFMPRPDVGAAGGRWMPITLLEALALDTPGVLDLPVQTWTDASAWPGDRSLSVLTADELGLSAADWFQPGDTVVVDPGGAYEQVLTLRTVDGHLLGFESALSHRMDDPVHVLLLRADDDSPVLGGGPAAGDGPAVDSSEGGDGGAISEDAGGQNTSGQASTGSDVDGDAAGAAPGLSNDQSASTADTDIEVLSRTGVRIADCMRLALLLLLVGAVALRVGAVDWRSHRPGSG